MNSLTSINNAKSLNMNTLNSNYHAPSVDNFCPPPISSGHYAPAMPPSLARVSSIDGSDDNTDNSSNGSNSANELFLNIPNASMMNANNSYFYAANEVLNLSFYCDAFAIFLFKTIAHPLPLHPHTGPVS